MKSCKLKIFCDFDGTVSKNDVWINTILQFINDKDKFDNVIKQFHDGNIGTRETGSLIVGLIENFSPGKFNDAIDKEEIDEYFKDFIIYCRENNFELRILSSGWDHYINRIFDSEKIDLKVYSTELVLEKSEDSEYKLSTKYNYTDEYCQLCETCKRNILITNTNDLDNEVSVFIGDGASDYCVSNFADIVFAKGKLASYCWKNNITYFEYKNFHDIQNKLEKMISAGKIKQRQEARVRRKDIFMGG
ncbi:MAG TPA: HAD-IB family phosphatase [Ignavibacteria bacterium]|nr:HAD-IB family phosphatase [Ignavibacteria bacterium]HMR38986.1 HAD-IB family phosphatase [Ignavibacteria bacterium]